MNSHNSEPHRATSSTAAALSSGRRHNFLLGIQSVFLVLPQQIWPTTVSVQIIVSKLSGEREVLSALSSFKESKVAKLVPPKIVMINPLHRLCCGWVCVTKDRENLRGIPKYDRKVMVSPHLGKFSQEDVADGRGWTKSIFYSRKNSNNTSTKISTATTGMPIF